MTIKEVMEKISSVKRFESAKFAMFNDCVIFYSPALNIVEITKGDRRLLRGCTNTNDGRIKELKELERNIQQIYNCFSEETEKRLEEELEQKRKEYPGNNCLFCKFLYRENNWGKNLYYCKLNIPFCKINAERNDCLCYTKLDEEE